MQSWLVRYNRIDPTTGPWIIESADTGQLFYVREIWFDLVMGSTLCDNERSLNSIMVQGYLSFDKDRATISSNEPGE
jgi:hypothetical protein